MLAASLMLGSAPVTSAAEPPAVHTPPSRTRAPLGCRGQKTCLRLTIGSIGVSTLGIAGIATGSALLLRPDRVDLEQPIFVTSTRQAGLVTVMLGVGVTLTAVLMFIAARRNLAPAQRSARRVELTPAGLMF